MDKKRSTYTSTNPPTAKDIPSKKTKAKGDCFTPSSSSHTQYFRKEQYKESYKRITTDEYCGISESVSGSSDTFHCLHGPDGKQYTDKGKLKRNIMKELDPVRACMLIISSKLDLVIIVIRVAGWYCHMRKLTGFLTRQIGTQENVIFISILNNLFLQVWRDCNAMIKV